MLVTNKHFTPVIGLDIHIVILFGFPIPLPHPYIGLVVDPMDYVPFIGASTKVNHVPCGKSDTNGRIIILFHIPMGGPFLLAPMIGHDSVNFFGSKKVKVEGNLMSPAGHMLMTCNDIGIPLSLQPGKKFIPIPSLYLPTSYSIPVSFGKPVMVGGPFVPDWAGVLMNLIMSYGFGALMKGLGKAGKKAMTKFNKALKNKLGSNKLSKFLCKKGFEPVDLVQGIMIYDGVDFELPGPIPLKWERSWNSDSRFQGLLGHGTHLSYDMRVYESPEDEATVVLLGDGRSAVFDPLLFNGESDYNRHEHLRLTRTAADEFELHDYSNQQDYTFRKLQGSREFRLVAIRDQAGFLVSLHYGSHARLLRIIDSAGRHLHISTDTEGRITAVTAHHRGQQQTLVRYAYNDAGDLAEITDALGQTTYMQYRDHLMVTKKDRNGQSFYWEYDSHQRCIHTWGDGGLLEGRISYHPREGYNLVTDSLGATTTYYYTPDFVVHQIKDPMGHSTFFEYTAHMEIYRVIDPEGNVNGYTYDEDGNTTAIVQPDGTEYTFAYDAQQRLVLASDPEGASRTNVYYKDTGLLHTVTAANGRIQIFRYNEQHLVSAIEDEQENLTRFTYDEDHNLQTLTLPDGGVASWQYDAWGHCTASRNLMGREQLFRYDALGRVTEVKLPDNNHIQLHYNAYEEVLRMTDRHYDIRFDYTPLGSLKTRTENGNKIHFNYNSAEQLTAVINEHGERYAFRRNACGDIIQETGFDGITRTYERDSSGKVTRIHRPGQRWTEYEYDANGSITRAAHHDGSWELYSYNRNGQLIAAENEHSSVTFTRDTNGRIIQEWQDGHIVERSYDDDGRCIGIQSSLGAAIRMQRSKTGWVTGVEAANTADAGTWTAHILRNMMGLEIERTLPGGVKSSWAYDAAGNPLSHTVQRGSRTTRSRQYHWDANQRLKQFINQVQHGSTKFGYDEVGNLAWAQYEDGQYDYRLPDKAGNLYKTSARNDRKYSAGGRLQESADARYQYDEEGKLLKKIVYTMPAGVGIWEYEWYGNGMLKQVTRPDRQVIAFEYDALGRRISKRYKGRLTRFVWDGNVPLHEWHYPLSDKPVITMDDMGSLRSSHPEPVPPETLATWVFEDDAFTPAAKIIGGKQYSIITDHLGTPAEAYDESGELVWSCELDIYGKVRKLSGDRELVPFRYQGQYEDVETGLYYNRFRYYDPDEGVYISQDPIAIQGGLNVYAYVHDPNSWIDEFGLSSNPISFTDSTGFTLDVSGYTDISHMSDDQLKALYYANDNALKGKGFGLSGVDKQGNTIVLHHYKQNPNGPIVALPGKHHDKPHVNPGQHPFGKKKGGGLTASQRDAFNKWKQEYWKSRAETELKARGITCH
ncbi:RHS repeat-associated core domain-containing protein [Chitinophaga vietnamensis]|uniref:RHS repeat-associated core domain-containing protein n=1 Tax=Chitinophaga vietnamensis TaxID=2593957 RepID=UPI001177EC8F|nr:RHS repeat-associated core domain-containing protein [Chitinophaga vietnamensis]